MPDQTEWRSFLLSYSCILCKSLKISTYNCSLLLCAWSLFGSILARRARKSWSQVFFCLNSSMMTKEYERSPMLPCMARMNAKSNFLCTGIKTVLQTVYNSGKSILSRISLVFPELFGSNLPRFISCSHSSVCNLNNFLFRSFQTAQQVFKVHCFPDFQLFNFSGRN